MIQVLKNLTFSILHVLGATAPNPRPTAATRRQLHSGPRATDSPPELGIQICYTFWHAALLDGLCPALPGAGWVG